MTRMRSARAMQTGVENFHEIAMDHPGWAELCNQVFETYHAGLMQVRIGFTNACVL